MVASVKNERIERQLIRIMTLGAWITTRRSEADRREARAKLFAARPNSRINACSASKSELGLEEVVHRLRIGLTAGRFQHLSDEPPERLRIGF